MAVRSLPDVLLLQVRSARGDCPVFHTSAKKELPAFEITTDCFLGKFLAADTEDLKKECRKRASRIWKA